MSRFKWCIRLFFFLLFFILACWQGIIKADLSNLVVWLFGWLGTFASIDSWFCGNSDNQTEKIIEKQTSDIEIIRNDITVVEQENFFNDPNLRRLLEQGNIPKDLISDILQGGEQNKRRIDLLEKGRNSFVAEDYSGVIGCFECVKTFTPDLLTQKDYLFLGRSYSVSGRYKEARKVFEKLNQQKVTILRSIGFACHCEGDYNKALEFYNKSLKVSIEKGDKEGETRILYDIGLLYRELDINKALKYYLDALKIAQKIKDKKNEAIILNHVGEICLYYLRKSGRKSDLLTANSYCQGALNIIRELKHIYPHLIHCLVNMGIIEIYQNNLKKASELLELALDVSEDIGYKRGKAATLDGFGVLYKAQGNIDLALKNHLNSLNIAQKIGYKGLAANQAQELAYIYRHLDNKKKKIIDEMSKNET